MNVMRWHSIWKSSSAMRSTSSGLHASERCTWSQLSVNTTHSFTLHTTHLQEQARGAPESFIPKQREAIQAGDRGSRLLKRRLQNGVRQEGPVGLLVALNQQAAALRDEAAHVVGGHFAQVNTDGT